MHLRYLVPGNFARIVCGPNGRSVAATAVDGAVAGSVAAAGAAAFAAPVAAANGGSVAAAIVAATATADTVCTWSSGINCKAVCGSSFCVI